MGGRKALIFVQNFDAVLVVTVVSTGDAIFAKFHEKLIKHIDLHISRYMVCCFFQEVFCLRSAVDSEGPGHGPGPGSGAQHGPKWVQELGIGRGSGPFRPSTNCFCGGGGSTPSLPTPVAASTGRPPPGQKCLLLLRRPCRPFKN